MTVIVCKEIRRVRGGFIVVIRWPFGPDMPYGEVICKDFDEVVRLLDGAQEGINP
jgi:hypothetical protein